MAEETTEFRAIPYRQLFPWLELFRAFRIALDPKKLLLGAGGVALMYAGYVIIGQGLWGGLDEGEPPAAAQALGADLLSPLGVPGIEDGELGVSLESFLAPLRPAQVFLTPFRNLFSLQGSHSWTLWPRFLVTLLSASWMVLVWAYCGGAICRLAAVQVARDEKVGLLETLRFSFEKYFSFVAAPLFPLVFVGLFLVLCFVGGGVAWLCEAIGIGVLGALIDGVLMFLLLSAGFVMAFILVGLAVGWPLMLPTIAAEGSDSFDALSRSLSYVFQRPWHYLFYGIVATVYGTVVIAFVFFFTDRMVHLSAWAASSGAGRSVTSAFFEEAPEASGWRRNATALVQSPGDAGESVAPPSNTTRTVANVLGAIWLYLLFLLLLGFVHSYFWTAATTIYLLLRRDVDATELDEVYLEEEDEDALGASFAPDAEPDFAAAPVEGDRSEEEQTGNGGDEAAAESGSGAGEEEQNSGSEKAT